MTTHSVRVVLPAHLRVLGRVDGEVVLAVDGPVTQRSVLDALELRHPVLRGTIREHGTLRRRAFAHRTTAAVRTSEPVLSVPAPSM